MGGRKLFMKLNNLFKLLEIKYGRDKLFDLLVMNNLLVKNRKRKVFTTNSNHWYRKYPNLIGGLIPDRPNQLWVTDITYWRVGPGDFAYITLITDAYSKKIVGYNLANNLASENAVRALQMALKTLPIGFSQELIHHSDRGIQFCTKEYTELLDKHNIQISMTQNGDPRENAIAERVNGIIKNEYLGDARLIKYSDRIDKLIYAVHLYNTARPHLSLNYHTPEQVHKNHESLIVNKVWKNYYKTQPSVNPLQD
jgi:transposase InsO family protein